MEIPSLTKFLLAQYYWVPLAPIAISVCGILIASRLSRGRWIVHVAIVLAMLLAPYLSIYLREIADPTLIEGPGPGDGIVMLFYLTVLVLCLISYGVAATVLRLRDKKAKPPTISNR